MHGYGSQGHQAHATHPTHRMEGAGRAKWAFDEQVYGGKLAEDQNPGAMEWMLLKSSKRLGRGNISLKIILMQNVSRKR